MNDPAEKPDYALLDRLGAASMIFYPRPDWRPPPPGALDHLVEVDAGIAVAVRAYLVDNAYPAILLFHGNGEVASDYDDTAPLYHQAQVNLVVADFRGYGRSNGLPTVASMVDDAHRVHAWFQDRLDGLGCSPRRFVMGRSLGTHSALELAANATGLEGLIVESGASNLARLVERFYPGGPPPEAERVAALHQAKVAGIRLPALILHGAEDELIPLETAVGLYDTLPAEAKTLVVIPGAGHNNILYLGWRQYFTAIRQFIHGAPA